VLNKIFFCVDGIFNQYRIAVMLGDGIGVEVMEVARQVLEVSKLDVE
jgi:isocitrate/isopropylmalate dehydrogenase